MTANIPDIVILSTVQSFDADDDDARDLRLLAYNEFFKHAGRALSAVSRPVHAFFMVANMEALEVNAVYRRYLEFARRHTTVVTSEYRLVTFCPPTYAPYVQAKASYPVSAGDFCFEGKVLCRVCSGSPIATSPGTLPFLTETCSTRSARSTRSASEGMFLKKQLERVLHETLESTMPKTTLHRRPAPNSASSSVRSLTSFARSLMRTSATAFLIKW